jgi:predicted ABC-type ATPase
MATKELVVVGGPNGAGKTTAAFDLLPKTLPIRQFVNADEIARGLSPFDPEGSAIAAGRIMLQRIRSLVEARESLAFETTCASRAHARLIRDVQELGYRVTLLFLWLPSPGAAVERVARRVREGGHQIPPDVIQRRYWVGLRNMRHLYLPLVDIAVIYDNSDSGRALVAECRPGARLIVRDKNRWKKIEEATQ